MIFILKSDNSSIQNILLKQEAIFEIKVNNTVYVSDICPF